MARIVLTAILIVGLALLAVACGDDDDESAPDGTTTVEDASAAEPSEKIVLDNLEAAVEEGGLAFNTFLQAVEVAGLEEALDGEGPITVFIPFDPAFAALPDGQLDALLDDPEALREVLEYHLVADDLSRDEIFGLDAIETVQGEAIAVTDDGYSLNDEASFFDTDLPASNGTGHVITTVLIPPEGG